MLTCYFEGSHMLFTVWPVCSLCSQKAVPFVCLLLTHAMPPRCRGTWHSCENYFAHYFGVSNNVLLVLTSGQASSSSVAVQCSLLLDNMAQRSRHALSPVGLIDLLWVPTAYTCLFSCPENRPALNFGLHWPWSLLLRNLYNTTK